MENTTSKQFSQFDDNFKVQAIMLPEVREPFQIK